MGSRLESGLRGEKNSTYWVDMKQRGDNEGRSQSASVRRAYGGERGDAVFEGNVKALHEKESGRRKLADAVKSGIAPRKACGGDIARSMTSLNFPDIPKSGGRALQRHANRFDACETLILQAYPCEPQGRTFGILARISWACTSGRQ